MSEIHPEVPIVLEKLCTLFGSYNVILAGGAIRDWYFGNDIKDYDFFIKGNPHIVNHRVLTGCGLDVSKKESFEPYDDTSIKEIYDCNYGGAECQFIILKGSPIYYLEDHFDYNICKCYYYPYKNDLVFTEEFRHDEEYNVLTVNVDEGFDMTAPHFKKREERMRSKFNSWPILVKIIKHSVLHIGTT